jgi:hypothetical protein
MKKSAIKDHLYGANLGLKNFDLKVYEDIRKSVKDLRQLADEIERVSTYADNDWLDHVTSSQNAVSNCLFNLPIIKANFTWRVVQLAYIKADIRHYEELLGDGN